MSDRRKPLHEALAAAKLGGGSGGSGGTSDYRQLSNLPSINGTILIGNKTLSDLGIEWIWRGTRSEYEATKATIPPNTFVDITDEPDMDNVPTQGSLKPVTSNGLYAELSKLKVINENPENHNGIYRGKDLTDVYTWDEIYARVHDGSFEDLYLGDYKTTHIVTDLYTRFTGSAFESGVTYYEMGGTVIARTWTETQDTEPQSGKVYATKQVVEEDVDYMIAGFDIYENIGGATAIITKHHAIIIPRNEGYITKSAINAYGADSNGYAGTDMHNIVIPSYAESTKNAVSGHLLTRQGRLSSHTDSSVPSMAGAGLMGASTASADNTYYGSLCNDIQLFGSAIMLSSFQDIGVDYEKFPVFNFVDPLFFYSVSSSGTWLRTVNSVGNGGMVLYTLCSSAGGRVSATNATNTRYVRPYFLFG